MEAGDEPPREHGCRDGAGPGCPALPGTPEQHHESAQGEHPEDLRLGRRDHECVHEDDGPEKRITAHARPEQLAGASGHDGDDGGADSVEGALHPRERAESDVKRG